MKTYRSHRGWPPLLPLAALATLAACATPPPVEVAQPTLAVARTLTPASVDETSMLPLLGYQQLLMQLSTADLAQQRRVLAAIAQTPATQVRQAMLLGQVRSGGDLPGALGLVHKVLKSDDPAAVSLRPLAQLLASQYLERLRLQAQGEKLALQLGETQRRSSELQGKLDALTEVERSLPAPTSAGNAIPKRSP